MANNPATAFQTQTAYRRDYFLSHSGADIEIAKRFKHALEPPAEVFLDKEDIAAGEVWSDALPKALQSSFVYVFLLSRNAEGSFYVGAEIDIAVSLLNANRQTRRVVPVYLNEKEVPPPDQVPFGLGSIQGFALPDVTDLSGAEQRLREVLQYVKPLEEKKAELVSQGRSTIAKLNAGTGTEVFACLNEATKLVRPLYYTLLVLFVLVTVGIVGSLLFASSQKALILIVLGIQWCLLLLFILWLTIRALGDTGKIAQGQINGG